KVGEKVKVKVKVVWKLNTEGVLVVSADQVPDGGPKVPKEFAVKAKNDTESETEYEIEITGGSKPGVTTVQLRPGVSKRPVELVIETTK
ncbi:hypothetical protein, partial [Burkholderia sp. GbtcB21]|uniref:hypothetical protein n=1 Tax=Burkholderia sp. GbtcB21 TaxID=2824766 RepID=UPI001C309DF5